MNNQPSYINAAAYSGLTFGLIISAISLVSSYIFIGQEPSGSFFGITTIAIGVACLIGAFAGLFAAKLYVNEHNVPVKLGTGAVIGVVTGLVVAFVSVMINLLWHFMIDSTLTDRVLEATIVNIEMMDALPRESREDMIDSIAAEMQNQFTLSGILKSFGMSAILYAVLNSVSGTLGAKFFAEQPEESLDEI